jgi:integrase
MSSVFKRGDIYYVKVKGSSCRWIARTAETRDRSLARSMGRMLDELGHRGRQSWELMDAVVDGRLSLSLLYAAYAANSLEVLRDGLRDIDLAVLVEDWLFSISSRVVPDTVEHYRYHVRSLISEGKRFPRSELTFERLSEWLANVQHSSGTRRKYHAAMSSFCKYLRARGVLDHNPMQHVAPPRAGAPRCESLEHSDVLRLLDFLEEPYRTIEAVLHGTGIEVSVLLGLKRRDIDFAREEIRARGTKTKARDRLVPVEPWAMEYLKGHARRMHPNAPVFPGLNRWTVSDKHRQACAHAGIENYQLRDARHTFAVRAIRCGAPFEVVAQNLGHADTTMVARVYGRFRPNAEEMRSWHRVAELRDAAKEAR